MALFRMGFVALLPCELPPYRCHVAAATAATIPLCLLRWNCLVGCLPLFAVLTSHRRTPRDALLFSRMWERASQRASRGV